ncbi:FACT complex subunit SPT16-like [Corticium candelabrum]|uniref:FACT complex subunit SPT16-like n=1 Tax=Corticium candelabrum TaxID=121492 RepID=UPI002E25C293|nr:FACT complex subunit SPT16-like [Corticium candelabrum]
MASLDKEAFIRRISRLYKAWENDSGDLFQGADAFVSTVGQDEEVTYAKSTALQTWLFGYELPDTLTLFCKSEIIVLSSKKKNEFLKPVSGGSHDGIPEVQLLLRNKDDNSDNFKRIFDAVKKSGEGKKLGMFLKDKLASAFIKQWNAALEKETIEKVDVSAGFAYVMAPKDDSELTVIKRAAQLSSDIFGKYFKTQIMETVDEEKRVKHSRFAELIEKAATEEKKYTTGMDLEQVEMCYPPIVQSGGKFQLKFSVVSDDNKLHFGVIICSLGTRYKSYCSNVIRTMLVEPTQEQQDNYLFLVELEELVLDKLRHGVKLCDVYGATVDHVKAKKPELESCLTRTIGFAMGIEFRESSLMISAKTTAVAQKGMVFNINLGFSGLTNAAAVDEADKNYALFIGDTVVVQEGKPAESQTATKKQIKNIAIFLKGEDEEDEDQQDGNVEDDLLISVESRNAVLDVRTRPEITAEKRRKLHQSELAAQMHEEAKRRLAESKGQVKERKVKTSNVAYRHLSVMPVDPDVQEAKIFVDRKHETVVLPISGIPTPFHVSSIKNISKNDEGDYSYLRINFYFPGSTFGRTEGTNFINPDATFLKEVTYRSSCVRIGHTVPAASNLSTAFRLIKEVQKKWRTREAERKEMEGIVEQATLQVAHGKNVPKLKDVYIRPNITAGKTRSQGVVEAHVNGIRFTAYRGPTVDILYANVKHAFFQPCDNEMIILIHFHLKHPILLGKKKQQDIQFYTEVGEIVTDLGHRQTMHDRDDLQAEQAEREMRSRLNHAFDSFRRKVEALTRQELEFDVPFRDLGFHGVPVRSSVLVQPTTHCLVHLTEMPFFVIVLDEIELVHFERVQFHLKNFDIVFVFKDYSRKVAMVSSVPMSSLDAVKEWLDSCDIKYTEGIQSLNWTKIMKTINDNPDEFFENGGWSFLIMESDSEGEDEEGEDAAAYEPSVSGSGEEYRESSSDDYSMSEVDEISEEGELGSDESEGKDWDELEKEAQHADDAKPDWELDEAVRKKSSRKRHSSSTHASRNKRRK